MSALLDARLAAADAFLSSAAAFTAARGELLAAAAAVDSRAEELVAEELAADAAAAALAGVLRASAGSLLASAGAYRQIACLICPISTAEELAPMVARFNAAAALVLEGARVLVKRARA